MNAIHPITADEQISEFEADRNRFVDAILHSGGTTPFGAGDSSVGMEYELQVAVKGSSDKVDLPLSIHNSSYYENMEKRAESGDLSRAPFSVIESFITENMTNIWENSWVRFSEAKLNPFARAVLHRDFLWDKKLPKGPQRSDIARFYTSPKRGANLRLPVSYVLKLALADVLGTCGDLSGIIKKTGEKLLEKFQSDNTSPEILSLTIPTAGDGRIGDLAAQESARTFLVTQLLVQYANIQFGLLDSGQRCLIYNAPHAPLRQKKLNKIVSDSYYRQLFLSPCLSGWDKGEEKSEYMSLCHKTLSRSQLNSISKLRDAGIITNNLVILPNTSNTCLANNGTHVSLGSALLSELASQPGSGFTPCVEKYYGDLVIKIVEHFLPLSVTTYSGAPYRVDFADFHPESMLGFLPHELDYTHLRMLWRRWKKKADIRFMGRPFTPFGPHQLDRLVARCFRLQGDLIPDFRLIDYLVTLLSTGTSPSLDGTMGNQDRLKKELTEMGVFDSRMSMYLPYRMRAYSHMGYSGFEGRSYSLFPSLLKDMAPAVDLQNLITALAYRYVLKGEVSHNDIPDTPFIESERRQIFFACAINIPTVYIRKDSRNHFLGRILNSIKIKRSSRRYRNYIRIGIREYRLALLEILIKDGSDLIDLLDMREVVVDLKRRITQVSSSAAMRLINDSRDHFKERRGAEKVPADIFNNLTESYYRTELKKYHMAEGLLVLRQACLAALTEDVELYQEVMASVKTKGSIVTFIHGAGAQVIEEKASPEVIITLLKICLALIAFEERRKEKQ